MILSLLQKFIAASMLLHVYSVDEMTPFGFNDAEAVLNVLRNQDGERGLHGARFAVHFQLDDDFSLFQGWAQVNLPMVFVNVGVGVRMS
jgi:hypothetical protein